MRLVGPSTGWWRCRNLHLSLVYDPIGPAIAGNEWRPERVCRDQGLNSFQSCSRVVMDLHWLRRARHMIPQAMQPNPICGNQSIFQAPAFCSNRSIWKNDDVGQFLGAIKIKREKRHHAEQRHCQTNNLLPMTSSSHKEGERMKSFRRKSTVFARSFRSAGFQTCRIADFQIGMPSVAFNRSFLRH